MEPINDCSLLTDTIVLFMKDNIAQAISACLNTTRKVSQVEVINSPVELNSFKSPDTPLCNVNAAMCVVELLTRFWHYLVKLSVSTSFAHPAKVKFLT